MYNGSVSCSTLLVLPPLTLFATLLAEVLFGNNKLIFLTASSKHARAFLTNRYVTNCQLVSLHSATLYAYLSYFSEVLLLTPCSQSS